MNKLHRSFRLLSIVLIMGAISFSSVRSYGHPHFSNELSNPNELSRKTATGKCNYTVHYEGNTGQVKTRAHEVKMLKWWLMLYPCTGSSKRIISIPVQRVIQVERD